MGKSFINGQIVHKTIFKEIYLKVLSASNINSFLTFVKPNYIYIIQYKPNIVYLLCIVTFVHINENDWNSTMRSFSENTARKTRLDYSKLDFHCIFVTLTEKTNPYEPFQSNYIHIETYWISLYSQPQFFCKWTLSIYFSHSSPVAHSPPDRPHFELSLISGTAEVKPFLEPRFQRDILKC